MDRMKYRIVITAALLSQLAFADGGQSPGWKLVKDSTNSCEISVPDNWGQSVLLVKSGGKVRTFSELTQKQVTERMLSNTPELVFYVMKTHSSPGTPPLVTYQASVPGDGYHCTAQINVKPSFPEAGVQKIVATFKASRQ
ncbi:MAG TPA: hypothetical protein VKV39_13225 [Candidatus Sulfotelmatobacter sp.]|nr:hypothetical protein [Candidatus Sulfotelmatobacter sp.]